MFLLLYSIYDLLYEMLACEMRVFLWLSLSLVVHACCVCALFHSIRLVFSLEFNANLHLLIQVLLGDVGAGKSSLVLRFVKGQFVDFQVCNLVEVWIFNGIFGFIFSTFTFSYSLGIYHRCGLFLSNFGCPQCNCEIWDLGYSRAGEVPQLGSHVL